MRVPSDDNGGLRCIDLAGGELAGLVDAELGGVRIKYISGN